MYRQVLSQSLNFEYDESYNSFYIYSSEIIQMAKQHFKDLIDSRFSSNIEITQLILNLWSKNKILPSLSEIVYFHLNDNNVCVCYLHDYCNNLYNIEFENLKDICRHYLTSFGKLPKCEDISVLRDYYILSHHYPTQEELTSYLNNLYQLSNYPDIYYQENRLQLPTPNLEKIKSVTNQEEDLNCALCQEEIKLEKKIYILNPCGHFFHAEQSDCLENKNIIDWLKTDKYCPICKSEIKIE